MTPAAPSAPSPPELLRDADFVRLWSAATITNFGSMVTQLALPFAAIQVLDASAAELGVLRALVLVPGFALGLLAGAWLERLRRRPVMVASDLARATLQASVAGAAALGLLGMGWLYAVAAGAGLSSFVFHVARDAHLPDLVPKERLVEANARLRGGEAVSEGAGFGVGGWLVQLLGAPQALLVDAASFVASAGLLARIRTPEPPPAPRARTRGARERLREAGEGLRFVLRDPQLAPVAAATALLLGAWQMTSVVYLLFLDGLGFGAGWLGVVFAAGSLSSLLGAAAAGAAGRRLGPRRSMTAGLAVLGASLLLVPLVPGPGVLGFSLLVAQQLGDCGEVVFEVHQSSLRQSLPPAELRARVNAGFGFLAQGAMLAGTALGALAGETLGTRPTLFLSAAGVLLAAVIVGRGLRLPASVGGR